MSIEAITLSGAAAETTLARAEKVRARSLPTYDYEKVFWNATYTTGIVTLAWAAVKIGKFIDGLSGLLATLPGTTLLKVEFYADQPAFGLQKQFFEVVEWVEGIHKDGNTDELRGSTWGTAKANAIDRYRTDLEEYESFKTIMFQKWMDAYPSSNRPTLEAQYAIWQGQTGSSEENQKKTENQRLTSGRTILEAADSFFNEYGPIVPLGAVMGHMGLEALRIRKLQKGSI